MSKLAANVGRDARNAAALERDDWRVIIVWACGTDRASLEAVIEGVRGMPVVTRTRARTARATRP